MVKEVTNNALARIDWIGFAAMLVLGGIAWGTLSATVSALGADIDDHAAEHDKEIKEVREDQKVLEEKVTEVDKKLSVIINEQKHFKEKLDESLLILRSQYPAVP